MREETEMESSDLSDSILVPGRTSTGRRRAALFTICALVIVAAILFASAVSDGEGGSQVTADDLLSTTTLPDPLRPVNPATLEDGYYLRVASKVFTHADEPLLAAAQELMVEARTAGYADAKIVRRPASKSTCTTNGCVDGMPAVGYIVILKGPYPVPIDVEDQYEWRRQLWIRELEVATTRGLTVEPSIYWYNFG